MRSGIVANYLCGAAILACAILAPKSGLAQTADTGLPNGLPSGEGIYDVRSESKIESLLSRMTLDEKVGQLVQVGLGPPQNGGGTKGTNYEEMIKEGRIGAILGRAGLPTQAPRVGAAKALELMQMDKKVLAGALRLVLIEKLGRAIVTADYPPTALNATLAEYFA